MADLNLRLRDIERRLEDIEFRLDWVDERIEDAARFEESRRPLYDALNSLTEYVGVALQEVDYSEMDDYLQESDKIIDDLHRYLMYDEYAENQALEEAERPSSIY